MMAPDDNVPRAVITQATLAARASEKPAICSARREAQPSRLQGHRWSTRSFAIQRRPREPALVCGSTGAVGQGRAALGVGVENHAVEAVQAFAVVDAAVCVDGLCTAAHCAGLAAVAVLLALEAKPAERAGHGQRGTQ